MRWSSMSEELQPAFWISNFQTMPCGTNNWLFDSRSQVTPGTFFGGGKR